MLSQFCTTFKQEFTINQIGHKIEILHGFALSTWFRKSALMITGKPHVSPPEHNLPKSTVKEAVATQFAHPQPPHNCTAGRPGWGREGGACTKKEVETLCEIRGSEAGGRS